MVYSIHLIVILSTWLISDVVEKQGKQKRWLERRKSIQLSSRNPEMFLAMYVKGKKLPREEKEVAK